VLLDFAVNDGYLWALWMSHKPSYSVTYSAFLQNGDTLMRAATWYSTHTTFDDFIKLIPTDTITEDMQQRILSKLCDSRVIPRPILQKCLNATDLPVADIEVKEVIQYKIMEEVSKMESYEAYSLTDEQIQTRRARAEVTAWRNLCVACFGIWLENYMPVSFSFFSQNRSTLGLINGSGLSLLRPCDSIETLYVQPGLSHEQRGDFLDYFELKTMNLLKDKEDILRLVDTIKFVALSIGEDKLLDFEQTLFHEQEPVDSVGSYVNILVAGIYPDRTPANLKSFMLDFRKKFRMIKNPKEAIELLMTLLEGNTTFEDTTARRTSQQSQPTAISQNMLNNGRLICDISSQILQTHFELCRDFFIFLCLISECRSTIGLDDFDLIVHLETDVCRKVSGLLKIYHTLSWLSSQYLTPPYSTDGKMYNLAGTFINVKKLRPSLNKRGNFLEVFFNDSVDKYTRSLDQLQNRSNSLFLSSHAYTVVYLALKTIQFLWCLSDDEKVNALQIAQMLWMGQQYDTLKEFSRLLLFQIPHLNHYLALYYLQSGQSAKAKDAFMLASVSIANRSRITQSDKLFESFDPNPLQELDREQRDRILKNRPAFYYFNAVRLLCEKHPDLVVYFANIALDEVEYYEPLDEADKNVVKEETAILYSVVFSYNLSSERFDDAYVALTLNPDDRRKKSDLRRFINVLCDKGLFTKLIQYPFAGISSFVEEILDFKARASDIAKQPNYYDILYSLYVHHNKMGKAAMTMYQLSKRLGKESDLGGSNFLRRQSVCIASVINALKTLPEQEQWLIFPTPEDDLKSKLPPSLLKRPREDESTELWTGIQAELQNSKVVTIPLLEREYLLAQAKVMLVEKHPLKKLEAGKIYALPAEDIIVLLCSAGMYDIALSICKKFDNVDSTRIIFEHLTMRCIEAQLQSSEASISRAISSLVLEEDISSYGNAFVAPVDQLWNLLKYYLEMYDERNSQYHRSVLDIIFKTNPQLVPPYWLTDTLSKHNPTALIKVYIKYYMLEKALNIARKYVSRSITQKQSPQNSEVISFTVLEHLAQQSPQFKKELERLITVYEQQ
jgi:hypothetical protein